MEPATAGAEIISEAYNLITGQRQNDYDHPLEDYSRTVDIFRAITGINLSAEEGIMFMVSMKLSRLANELNNELNVPDNTRDAIGYLGCLNMVRRKQREEQSEIDRVFDQLHKHYKTGDSTWG
jgi:hypothetical protein